jgi:hypothetical protein
MLALKVMSNILPAQQMHRSVTNADPPLKILIASPPFQFIFFSFIPQIIPAAFY